jgi:acetyl-CoA C-acetyltransferase
LSLDPRTPVLVGAGAVTVPRSPSDPIEPIDLMAAALERAAADAGTAQVLKALDVVMVPRGMWRYADPARVLADRVGASARTVIADIGVTQQTLITRACEAVARAKADVVAVVGGEARAQPKRERSSADGEGARADEVLEPHGEILDRLEMARGLMMPANQYAVMENALRHAEGRSIDEHGREIGTLYAAFSQVAATNPEAWNRAGASADEIRFPSPANRPISFPYNKLHVSQWNVNQAGALIIVSVEGAERLGIGRDRYVFPLAAAESNAMVALSARPDLHRSPAVEHVGRQLAALGGVPLAQVDHLDLYSCFPIAVRIQQRAFGIDASRQQTVTGGMTFGGGPLNNYVLQSTAKMAEVLRADPDSTGLVTCVSGMLTKFAGALWSARPPVMPFRAEDVTAAVNVDMPPRPLIESHDGNATIAGYTVTYSGQTPSQAMAVVDLPDGSRCIATSDDAQLAAAMVMEEWCGRPVRISGWELSA